MVKRLLLVAGGIAVVLTAVHALRARSWAQEAHEEGSSFADSVKRLCRLGEEQLAQMEASGAQLGKLSDACAGKLEKVPPTGLLTYFGALPKPIASAVGKDESLLPSHTLIGLARPGHGVGGLVRTDPRYESATPLNSLWLNQYLTDLPGGWATRKKLTTAGFDAVGAKYLLVNRLAQVQLPVDGGPEGLFFGRALIHVRVLDASSGELACEGVVEKRTPSMVTSHGRGRFEQDARANAEKEAFNWVRSAFLVTTQMTSLDALCTWGGEELCQETEKKFDGDER